MTRLKRVSPTMPGWTRKGAGRGFTYRDEDGKRLDEADIERIKSLAIPPAWKEVWICPLANGHLQALGTDDAGRRQYLYHPSWPTARAAPGRTSAQMTSTPTWPNCSAARSRRKTSAVGMRR